MEDYSSDEDVELGAYAGAMPRPRTARKVSALCQPKTFLFYCF